MVGIDFGTLADAGATNVAHGFERVDAYSSAAHYDQTEQHAGVGDNVLEGTGEHGVGVRHGGHKASGVLLVIDAFPLAEGHDGVPRNDSTGDHFFIPLGCFTELPGRAWAGDDRLGAAAGVCGNGDDGSGVDSMRAPGDPYQLGPVAPLNACPAAEELCEGDRLVVETSTGEETSADAIAVDAAVSDLAEEQEAYLLGLLAAGRVVG
jgi:hypothetical protein